MASAAREYRYAHREFSTNGSLARDLDWAVRERELEHAGKVPRHERTQAAPKVYHKEQALVRERQAIPVLSVLGVTAVAVAAVMFWSFFALNLVMLLLSYVQLTTLAADTVALKSELTVLQAENVSLTAQHEQMFDMATVKEVAAAAGMAKPTSSQITYLDLDSEDSAVVYRTETPSVFSRILSSLHHGVYAVVEYFD